MTNKKINVALVGLGFGGAFLQIWKNHPNVDRVVLYDSNQALCNAMAKESGITEVAENFDAILQDRNIDAVHLVTPIPCHEKQSVDVLESGKHCACTVPLATSLAGIRNIAYAIASSKKKYMAMETALYTIHYLHVKEMLERGDFGDIQFLRGAHYQDMENWPEYWFGLPPMHYSSHAISPLVKVANSRINRVFGLGSGSMRQELVDQYNNPFPIETALITFENGLKGEVTRSLFETAHDYTESFYVYGTKQTFEWAQLEHEQPIIMTLGKIHDKNRRGTPMMIERFMPRNRPELLPSEIQKYAIRLGDYDETNPQQSLTESSAGGHWGSHPHLVNEFVASIIEDRDPYVNFQYAANVCAAGILAHESALNGGINMEIPLF